MTIQDFPRPAEHPLDVLRAARNMCGEAGGCALIFISGTEGGAMRATGAVMAVSATGDHAGYLSAGCIDSDVKIHAVAAIKSGKLTRLRYGNGSPFIDIKLPCGGAIDLIICPRPSPDTLDWAIQCLEQRTEVWLTLDNDGVMIPGDAERASEAAFSVCYRPPLKVRIAGHGADCLALARLCHASGFVTRIQTPSEDMADYSTANIPAEVEIKRLTARTLPDDHEDDRWTAFVLLFHQHEWEGPLLRQALSGPAFYIGAVGSRRTHDIRCEALRSDGYSDADIARIHGPVGLVPKMRDASMLAISTLAEIITAHHARSQ